MFFIPRILAESKSFTTFATANKKGAIAQLVEQRTENPCVPGSIPGGTTFKRLIIKQLLIKVAAFFISFCVFFGGFSMIVSSHVNQDVNRKKKWL